MDDENDVLIMGDFNRNADCVSWDGLKGMDSMQWIIEKDHKTTIGKTNKRKSSYDNIWFPGIDATKS